MENCLISELKKISDKYKLDEKILLTPDFNTGRQILQTLSRNGPGWINFKTATVASLASEIASEKLHTGNIEKISSVESNFIIDGIFTRLAEEGALKYFEKHTINTGIINTMTDIIVELKMSGLSHKDIKEDNFIDPKKAKDIKLIFSRYEDAIKNKRLADNADIIAAANKILEDGSVSDRSIKYIVLSRYSNATLEKKFLNSISAGNLIITDEEEVYGLSVPKNRWKKEGSAATMEPVSNIERSGWLFNVDSAPLPLDDGTIDLFSGANYREELYGLFGRIVAGKTPLDRVEIIYTNSDPYLMSLYNICTKLGLPASFSEGLPGDRSRPGMALKGFLQWVGDGFAESHLRKRLRYSLIKTTGVKGTQLAHALRMSKVGWGKNRYSLVLNKEIADLKNKAKDSGEKDHKWKLDIYEELSAITKKLIDMVPPLNADGKVDFARLCTACLKFLNDLVSATDEDEAAYLSNLKCRLEVLARIAENTVYLEEAISKLYEVMAKLPFKTSGPQPGCLHISSLSSGGRSGRNNTYIVGMDSHKFPGTETQDPVLLDEERQKIDTGIRLSKDRLKEKLYDFASMLSGLRGKATVSYARYDIIGDRQMFPSSVYLQVHRLKKGSPTISYQELFSMPSKLSGTAKTIDMTGWWIERLTGSGSIKDGRDSIFDIYQHLKQGSYAIRQRSGSELTIYDGLIIPEGGELDPRKNSELVLSCSAIETYAENPYSFFLQYILKARRPEEVVKDRLVWLDPAQRGSLLHEVFQLFIKKIIDSPDRPGRDGQRNMINKILDGLVKKYIEEVPVPGWTAYDSEVEALRRDLEVFLDINSKLSDPYLTEFEFGYGDREPVRVSLGGGNCIRIKGKVDRVDIDIDSNYHVWDYKTGSAFAFNDGDYIVGGRQVQHILYGKAVEATLGKVVKSGYILPTEKGLSSGKGIVFERDPQQEERWQPAINSIMDLMAEGLFIISDKENPPYIDDSDIYGTDGLKKSIKNKIKNSGSKLLGKWDSLKDYR